MLSEVKKCAKINDIKGLRYIFIDSLDVDPTFEKYEQDYIFCKGLDGFFDDYVEITKLKQNSSDWNAAYWDQLKRDLIKNFSQTRFEHMIQVAKVVYSKKIERLISERKMKKTEVKTETKNIIPTATNINRERATIQQTISNKKTESSVSRSTQNEINEAQRQYEESERRKADIARKRAESEKRMLAEKEQKKQKKQTGIVVVVAIIIVVLIIVALQINNSQ